MTPRVLVGGRDERLEMAVAGSDELPPLRPIFVRPAVRPDPDRRPSRFRAALRGLDRLLWGRAPTPGTFVCIFVIAVVAAYVVRHILAAAAMPP